MNAHRRQLLQLCRGLALYIINGRLRGDSLGRYTYSSALGDSTVDYTITDLDLSSLRAFTVKPLKPFSDISQTFLRLRPFSNIFACFIDFKKAFDSIWHEELYLKLLDSGIGGKFYDLIKSMYTASQCAVKIGNQRTKFFPQGRGVRQGCSLSPTLFNIYINQLANILEHAPIQGLTLHRDKASSLRR